MVVQVHILTRGFDSPNGRAFLFPLIVHDSALKARNIHVKCFTRMSQAVTACDMLIVENKFFAHRWANESNKVLQEIADLREAVGCLLYFDITDSSTWDHARALPLVDGYYKNQLLRDRSLYLKPLYGYRIFSDYYHRQADVIDDTPGYSEPITDAGLLDKLGVGWHSGLADYSRHGLTRMALYARTHFKPLLRFPKVVEVVDSPRRDQDISCRFGVNYGRESVAWQRKRIQALMARRLKVDKLNRAGYFDELKQSRVVISPFGLGEITLKDFEVLLTGGLLFKPAMDHMETWPDLFVDGETMVTHSWHLDDFIARLDTILTHYDDHIEIAREGQRRYISTVSGADASAIFCDYFENILKKHGVT